MKIKGISGLHYYENVSEDLKQRVNDFLEGVKWEDGPGSRKVCQFGRAYSYTKRRLDEERPEIPPILKELIELIPERFRVNFDQVIINRYRAGERISAHTDSPEFGTIIACFSFGTKETMIFESTTLKAELDVDDLSLYVMSGKSREIFTHCMKPCKGLRYSVTFRTIN